MIASPSIKHDRTGSLETAIAMNGNRDEKSFPALVISRTPALSRRASILNPSCLISCSQPGPEGGALAGDGRHGSIIPRPGRVRSRNDMRECLENQQREVERKRAPDWSGATYLNRQALLRLFGLWLTSFQWFVMAAPCRHVHLFVVLAVRRHAHVFVIAALS
jgi:hypothetical protein